MTLSAVESILENCSTENLKLVRYVMNFLRTGVDEDESPPQRTSVVESVVWVLMMSKKRRLKCKTVLKTVARTASMEIFKNEMQEIVVGETVFQIRSLRKERKSWRKKGGGLLESDVRTNSDLSGNHENVGKEVLVEAGRQLYCQQCCQYVHDLWSRTLVRSPELTINLTSEKY